MLYLERFRLPSRAQEEQFFTGIQRTCHTTFYPFQVFYQREPEPFAFAPITIFYGGNGSGKSTVLNVIAEAVGAARSAPYNRSEFYEEYVKRCSFMVKGGQVPEGSRIITSDDVFDYLLEIRALNQGIDLRASCSRNTGTPNTAAAASGLWRTMRSSDARWPPAAKASRSMSEAN